MLPVTVAATAALGVAAGVTVSVLTSPSSISGDSVRSSALSISGDSVRSSALSISGDSVRSSRAGSTGSAGAAAGASSLAALPKVKPVTGNASVVGYPPAASFALETKAVVPSVTVPPEAHLGCRSHDRRAGHAAADGADRRCRG